MAFKKKGIQNYSVAKISAGQVATRAGKSIVLSNLQTRTINWNCPCSSFQTTNIKRHCNPAEFDYNIRPRSAQQHAIVRLKPK